MIGALIDGSLVFRSFRGSSEQGEPGLFRPLGTLTVLNGPNGATRGSVSIRGGASIRVSVGESKLLVGAPVGLAPLLAVGASDVAWMPGGTDSLYLWTGNGNAPVKFRLSIPFMTINKRERTHIEEDYLQRFARNGAIIQDALRPYLSIPSRISSVTTIWEGLDSTFWLRLQSGVTVDEGSIWVEIDASTTVRRCVTSTPANRVVGLGDSIALIASFIEDTEEFSISSMRLPTKACQYSGSLKREE